MNRNLLSKALVMGIIVLLVSVGIYPAIAKESISTINDSDFKNEFENIEAKDFLLETIVEIANNPDVKELFEKNNYELLDSDYNYRSVFFKLLIFKPRVLLFMFFIKPKMNTEYLNNAYNNGVEIVDVLGEQEALEMIDSIEIKNPQIFNDMTDIISNNPNLQERIEQLVDLECDCEDDLLNGGWPFPIICLLLFPLFMAAFSAWIAYHIEFPIMIMGFIGQKLNCFWKI